MPPTSSDGSPAIVVQSPTGPVYIDSVTGEIIGTGAATVGANQLDAGPGNYPPHGGLAGPSGVDGSSAVTSGTSTPNAPFNPATDRIVNQVNLPDGSQQVRFTRADGSSGVAILPANAADAQYRQNQIDLQNKSLNATNAATGASTTNANIAANTAANNLAEQQRQFNEQFGMDKAKFNQTQQQQQAQFDATQQLTRGNTLLGLGSRPDTLIKYLYALQGQQTPQGIQNTTANLPGYQNVIGTTNYGTAPAQAAPAVPARAAPAPTAPTTLSAPPPGTVAGGNSAGAGGYWDPGNATTGAHFIPGPTGATSAMAPTTPTGALPAPSLSAPQPALPGASATSTGYASPYQGLSGFNTDGTLRLAANDPDASRLMAANPGRYRIGFAQGGVIPEPVVGIGQDSGQTYEFGEEGPEAVVPNDVFAGLMKSIKKGTLHYTEDDGTKKRSIKISSDSISPDMPGMQDMADAQKATDMKGMPKMKNSYATGGTIGYGQTPSLGQNSSGFFNDPNLQNVVQRGYNSNPGVPLFPQVGLATNGGQSLIPSAQRMNALLPSEQQLYSGTLQDEFGAQPEDVFSMAKRLAPNVSGLRTPNYTS